MDAAARGIAAGPTAKPLPTVALRPAVCYARIVLMRATGDELRMRRARESSRGNENRPMTTELYLIRHGESVANVEPIIAGMRGDMGLTDRGREQGRLLEQRLRAEELRADQLYTSTLPRALQTAEYVARALQLPVQPDDDLHEVRPGEADGMTVDEWRTRYLSPGQSAVHDPFQAVSPGGESWAAFLARAGAALAALVATRTRRSSPCATAASSRRRFTSRSGSAAPATGSRSPRSTPASRGGGTGAGRMGAVSGRSSPSTTLATSPAP